MIYVLTASDKGLFRVHPKENQETNIFIFTPEIYIEEGRIRNDTNLPLSITSTPLLKVA